MNEHVAASTCHDWEGFAEQIAQSRDGQTLLFRVTRELAATSAWSDEAVRFRFEPRDDGTYEMVMRLV